MRRLEVRELGLVRYGEAWELQKSLAARRQAGEIPDQFLLVEHPHVITLGRNSHEENILLPEAERARLGIECFEINRGGDVTYHGPGQIVGYPILDLREWKRDVVAYVRGVEEAVIGALAAFGIAGGREAGATGVWVDHPSGQRAKICAIGVHISRWVTTHGFALNWRTDLNYFGHIVPCGLQRPVTSMDDLGVRVERERVHRELVIEFARVFDFEPCWQPELADMPAGR
jgi:lipoyl(octanoyl) transferase